MWLVSEGEVLASAEAPSSPAARMRGLIGRDHLEGALLLRRCRNVHTFGMRVAIDVAFCDGEGRVLRTCTIRPRRVSPFVIRSAMVIEAPAGAFERWGLAVGSRVEVKE